MALDKWAERSVPEWIKAKIKKWAKKEARVLAEKKLVQVNPRIINALFQKFSVAKASASLHSQGS